MTQKTAAVIGAGIVGLATAKALAENGFSVTVFERSGKSTGASIRNFGMVWPIGQTAGSQYHRACRSRDIWKSLSENNVLWSDNVGSLHVAYHADEWIVLQELAEIFLSEGRPVSLLNKEQVSAVSKVAVPGGLLGALYSTDEIIVDPRHAIANLPLYLKEQHNIDFQFGTCITTIKDHKLFSGAKEMHGADIIFICSGADFETLYPEIYADQPLTRCKLQMLRLQAQPHSIRMGAALCGALSLMHYQSFTLAPTLSKLRQRFETEMDDYLRMGIHVMACQNQSGEITVGDSHEYGPSPDPFDRDEINQKILTYLQSFARFENTSVKETWNGVYPKLTNGQTHLFMSPDPDVYLLNAVGGAGMTLSFGLAEELVKAL